MSDRLHWYPWYPDKFAEATADWPFMACAIYRALLDLQWKNVRIPAGRFRLATAINVDYRTVKKHWKYVGAKFQPVEGGLQNFRLEQHRLRALELHRKKSEGGRLGGRSRQALLKGVSEHKPKDTLQGVSEHLLTYKKDSYSALTSARKRAANGQEGRGALKRGGAGAIREDDPEVKRKRREAETLAAQHAKPRDDDDGMPF